MQSIEKPRDEPATAADGRGRQFLFMLHVISERFDLLRPGSERSGSLLQTPHELKPSDGKRIEAAPVGHLAFNLGESQGLSRPAGQSKLSCNRKQITGALFRKVPPGVALVREMRQEGKTFFHQGACAMARQCKAGV